MSSAVENPATDNPADSPAAETPVRPETLGPEATAADARAVAEAARETSWDRPSFAKGLYLGSFDLSLIHPLAGSPCGRRRTRGSVHGPPDRLLPHHVRTNH